MKTVYHSTWFHIQAGHIHNARIVFADGLFDALLVKGNKWTLSTLVRDAVKFCTEGETMVSMHTTDDRRLGDYPDAGLWDRYGHEKCFSADELERLGNWLFRAFNRAI